MAVLCGALWRWYGLALLMNVAVQSSQMLAPRVYEPLPLGSVAPQGWLLGQLIRQASTLSGYLSRTIGLGGYHGDSDVVSHEFLMLMQPRVAFSLKPTPCPGEHDKMARGARWWPGLHQLQRPVVPVLGKWWGHCTQQPKPPLLNDLLNDT